MPPDLLVQHGLRQVVVQPRRERGDPLGDGALGQLLHAHAVDVDGHVPRHVQQQVRAGDPPAAHGLVDDHGQAGDVAGPGVAGVRHAVLDHRGGAVTAVPRHRVEERHVHHRYAAQGLVLRDRVDGAHRVPGRRVVLEVDRGQVASGTTARQALDQRGLVRALQHDEVQRFVREQLDRHLARGLRPAPGAGPAQAVAAAVGEQRQDVVVRAGDERGGPRPVDVPDQDPHGAPSRSGTCRPAPAATSSRTAPATRRGDTVDRHG